MTASVLEFIPTIESQVGDRYVYGAETRFSDPNPKAFDCSELVEWGLARCGVPFVDGARNQLGLCKKKGTLLGSIDEGIRTFGALLFRMTGGDHVAVSLGNGQTFEARGRAYGVNYFGARGRTWTAAARIPGLDYARTPAPPHAEPGGTRVDTPDDVQVQAALGRLEQTIRRMHKLDPARFPLVDLGQRKPHLPPVQQAIHDAAERLDKEAAGIEAAYRKALGR